MSSFEVIDLQQGTPEWLDFRKNHIGASDAPIIMNASPWKTPYVLWQEKLGIKENSFVSPSMQRGIDMESTARKKYTEVTGIDMSPMVAKSKEHPFMIASLDGISKDQKSLLEIKCPGVDDHALAIKGIIPKKYMYQLIQQMLVTQRDHIDYFSYRNDDDFAVVSLQLKDVEEQALALIEEEKRFWNCVQSLEEPVLVSKDYDLKEDVEWNLTVGEYIFIKEKLKKFEQEERNCRDRLLIMANGKNCEGAGIRVSQHVRKGSVDYASIPEIQHVDVEKYRKGPTAYWKFTEQKTA